MQMTDKKAILAIIFFTLRCIHALKPSSRLLNVKMENITALFFNDLSI